NTIDGIFPPIITPKTGFKGSIKSVNPSCERIFITIKNIQKTVVFNKLSLQIKYTIAAAKYPQPIKPSIPHQPVVIQPEFSGVPLRKTVASIIKPKTPAPFKMKIRLLFNVLY